MENKYDILKNYWGYHEFREPQADIIDAVLSGQDVLALMPTGGGKSLCFQVPAMCKSGICIVVSPLIALMKDQVFNLKKKGIQAEAIYSGMNYRDIDRIFDNCAYGNIKFLYLSPERLMTDLARARISKMNVNLVAIDEAHCISQWGYDFRPPYMNIAEIREFLPENIPFIALTATATPEVVTDIQERLEFRKGYQVYRKSFLRSNLSYSVLYEENKPRKMVEILRKVRGTGIVYARSRKQTRDIANYLVRNKISADFYHAGLTGDERSAKQDAWIKDKIRVMVATNAFGMGIDKPDVRVVVHLDLPDNLEAYFQEAGRGGRDGKKSFAVMLYHENDRKKLERQYEAAYPTMDEIKRVWQALGSHYQLAVGSGKGEGYDFDIVDFSMKYDLEVIRVFNALKILERDGWLVMSEAVNIPPSVRFLMEKEELYDYQLKNKKLDLVIRRILQSHHGGFNQILHLRSFNKLAASLKLTPVQLEKMLIYLHKEDVLKYTPIKDKPQIVFLEERITGKNLLIDKQSFEFLKKRHLFRMQKAIAYAETPDCRSRLLLKYFGEKDSPKCGICDVCTGRTKSDLSEEQHARLEEKILGVIREEMVTIEDVMASFAPKWESKVIRVLEYLFSEEKINKDEDGVLGVTGESK